MRDDLLGFSIGALDDSEHEQIEQKLRQNPELQNQLEVVRRGLRPLTWDRQAHEPPAGLAARVCDLVADHAARPRERAIARPTVRGRERLGTETGSWKLADLMVVAGICIAATCLIFPALVNSRYHARISSCQENLRMLHQALTQYSDQNGGYYPAIPEEGNMAVAGIYAVMLREKSLVSDARVLNCPSHSERTLVLRIPSREDLKQAKGPQLVMMQRTMGGSYAYTLGYLQNGRLRPVRNRGGDNFVLVADASRDEWGRRIGGHGRGQNVLFRDGRVSFLTTSRRPGSQDDFFVNDEGQIEAGLHADDSVVADSARPPLVWRTRRDM